MAAQNSSGSSGRSSIFSGLKSRRSKSPNVRRLLELSVLYQQQQQDSQNSLPSSSASSNMSAWTQDASKKIQTLVKELSRQKKTNAIDELENAILRREPRTRCIIVPRTFGHSSSPATFVVEYCCLWRWPDLNNESHLKPVNHCQNAFHYQLDEICVNPFHYERVPNAYAVCVPHVQSESTQQRTDPFATTTTTVSNGMPKNAIYSGPFDEQSLSSPASVSSEATLVSSMSDNADSTESVDESNVMEVDTVLVNESPQQNHIHMNPMPGTQVRLEESREWCRLSYYEMSMRVGEQYRATQPHVIIDGFTNTSDAYRFSLGSLTNIHRLAEVERVRRAIGPGVKLYNIYGDVFAECLSPSPVFVQSPIGNRLQRWEPFTVCKIQQNVRFKIFDINQFTEILSAAIQEGYESVYNLTKICIIRMSLVKGWGADYGRPLVTSTPCWIEIYLDGPLKWIDNILLTMNGPQGSVNSVS